MCLWTNQSRWLQGVAFQYIPCSDLCPGDSLIANLTTQQIGKAAQTFDLRNY